MSHVAWDARVAQLEAEGLTRSDAQSVADVEEQKGRLLMTHTPIESPKDYFELTGECPTCHTTMQQYEAYRMCMVALKVCRNRIIALTGNIESCDMHPSDKEAEQLADDALALAQEQP